MQLEQGTPTRDGDSRLPSLENLSDDQRARALQILTTEHFTLQGGRSATISETNGRVSIFLGTVSSTLIALAFVGQMSQLGVAFHVFVLILLPSLFALGVVTYVRVCQSSTEDYVYTLGINRIRHGYAAIVPEVSPYFVLSTHDDALGAYHSMGIVPSRWQTWFTMGGTVAAIDSTIAGVFVGLVTGWLVPWPILVDVLLGAVVWILSLLVLMAQRSRLGEGFGEHLAPRFPTPS